MEIKNKKNELFNEEEKILKTARDISESDLYKDNNLLPSYNELIESYSRLMRLSSKIFRISDTQGRELKRRENEIKNLLDNVSQGFLTFGSDLLVNREYSAECINIFGKKIAGLNIIDLITSGNKGQYEIFDGAFRKVFAVENPEIQQVILKQLPSMLIMDDHYLNIKYKLIHTDVYNPDSCMIMLILTDITEKQKAEDQVLYLSYHDNLTGLHNRAYVDSILPQLQTTHSVPLSIIMIDMNGLKLTNDVFGHEVGDKLLVNLSEVFKQCCRKGDIVARWGGDEFLILLPNTDSIMCDNICDRITKLCSEVAPNPIELSVSIGTATMESPDTHISDLFGIAENKMYTNKMMESKHIRKKIILSIENVLYTKGYVDQGHINRIKASVDGFVKYSGININCTEMENLLLLAILHDIGKVAIPKEILGKKANLTASEWKIMQSHSEIGFRMALSIEEPILAQSILSMREKWDGTGYPYRLKYEQIPLIARIIAILEAYDVMTHERSYKKAYSKEEAIEEIKNGSGTQFDPYLVKLFVDNIDKIIAD